MDVRDSVGPSSSLAQEGIQGPEKKRRKIHMDGPDCQEFAGTSAGALPLTNPELVPKTSKDVNARLYPRKHSGPSMVMCHPQLLHSNGKSFINGNCKPSFNSDGKPWKVSCGHVQNKFPPGSKRQQSSLHNYFQISPKKSHKFCHQPSSVAFENKKKPTEDQKKTETLSQKTDITESGVKNKLNGTDFQNTDQKLVDPKSSSQQYYESLILMDEISEVNADDDVQIIKMEKPNTFGLIGDNTDDEENEMSRINYFETLPLELMENILCRLPMLDLCLSCVTVCKQWNEVISHQEFIPWKKKYFRFKTKEEHTVRGLDDIIENCGMGERENSLLNFIRYMENFKRRPGRSATKDLMKHSKYHLAMICISKSGVEMVDKVPHPWVTVAALCTVAHTVRDIQDIIRCLLHSEATCTATSITECLYCIATLLLALQRKHNLNRGLHYRVYYALYLFENKPPETHNNLDESVHKSSTGQQSLYRYGQRTGGVQLTHEQRRIINYDIGQSPGEIIKIIAFAGSGKTTTLVRFAQMRPHMKFLYVAFNRSVKEQAMTLFPRNVECRTTHSLAYQAVGFRYRGKMIFNLKPYFIQQLLCEGQKKELPWTTHCKLVLETLDSFTCSPSDFITTAHVPEVDENAGFLSHDIRMALLADSELLWDRMKNHDDREAKITHDVYMKLYQLTKPTISGYDCILIDEAQDLTLAQQDMLLRQSCTKILVGDPHQQIYSFRGARNALQGVDAQKIFHLTQSFRFGPEIAYAANCVLEVFKRMTTQTLVGKEAPGSIYGEKKGQIAYICRTNSRLFSEAAVQCEKENTRLGFVSGLAGYGFDRLLELYKMYSGTAPHELKDKFFQRFKSFAALENYAKNANDAELVNLIAIVRVYHSRIPAIVEKIKLKTAKDIKNATVVLSTAHKAKGMEFDTVILAEDYLQTHLSGFDTATFNVCVFPEDEMNLLYVALTRAKKCLVMNNLLYRCFTKAAECFRLPVSNQAICDIADVRHPVCCNECGVQMTGSTALKPKDPEMITRVLVMLPVMVSEKYVCNKCSAYLMKGFERLYLTEKELKKTKEDKR